MPHDVIPLEIGYLSS